MQEVPDSPLARVAVQAAPAVANSAPWLHRRVENVSFRDRLIFRRSVSVDFTIPDALPPFAELSGGQHIYYVPISLLRKWPPLFRLDIRTEDGRPIPLLTSRKNREIDAAVLAGLAPDGPLKQRLMTEIVAISAAPRAEAERAHDRLGDAIIERRGRLATKELQAWVQVLVLGGDLVRNSLLWVRVQAHPSQRQVIKFAYDETFDIPWGAVRGVVRSLGWVPYRHMFTLPHLGDGGSFHFQLEAPEGLEIQNVSFRIRHPWESDEEPSKRRWQRLRAGIRQIVEALVRGLRAKLTNVVPPLRDISAMTHEVDPPEQQPFHWNAGDRAYLYVSGRRKHWGVAKFDLRIDSRAFPTSALAVSVAIAILLTLATTADEAVVDQPRFGATIAVLLLVPGLLGYLIVRPTEHPLVTAHLVGVRRLVILAGSLPVVAAVGMLLAGPDNPDGVTPLWPGLAVLAWVISGLLLLSWILPGPAYGRDPGDS